MANSNLDYRLHLEIARAAADMENRNMAKYLLQNSALLILEVKTNWDDLDDMLDIELQRAILTEFYGRFDLQEFHEEV